MAGRGVGPDHGEGPRGARGRRALVILPDEADRGHGRVAAAPEGGTGDAQGRECRAAARAAGSAGSRPDPGVEASSSELLLLVMALREREG